MKTFILITLAVIGVSSIEAQQDLKQDPINVVCNPSEDGYVVFVPHPYECNKYFMCQGMTGIAMHCPADLQFDTNLNVCNYPQVVNCVNTPYPTTSTTEIPETTTNEDEETTTDEEYDTTIFPDDYEDYNL